MLTLGDITRQLLNLYHNFSGEVNRGIHFVDIYMWLLRNTNCPQLLFIFLTQVYEKVVESFNSILQTREGIIGDLVRKKFIFILNHVVQDFQNKFQGVVSGFKRAEITRKTFHAQEKT